jgi:hypothetical protein
MGKNCEKHKILASHITKKASFSIMLSNYFSRSNYLISLTKAQIAQKNIKKIVAGLFFYIKFASQMCGTWTMKLK